MIDLEEVNYLPLRKGDVIVIRSKEVLTSEQVETLTEQIKYLLSKAGKPEIPFWLIDPGMKLEVLRREELESA